MRSRRLGCVVSCAMPELVVVPRNPKSVTSTHTNYSLTTMLKTWTQKYASGFRGSFVPRFLSAPVVKAGKLPVARLLRAHRLPFT